MTMGKNIQNPTTAYTESDIPSNIKPRKVKCEHCHYELITDLPGPKCRMCKRFMITVLNELVDESCKPAQ